MQSDDDWPREVSGVSRAGSSGVVGRLVIWQDMKLRSAWTHRRVGGGELRSGVRHVPHGIMGSRRSRLISDKLELTVSR